MVRVIFSSRVKSGQWQRLDHINQQGRPLGGACSAPVHIAVQRVLTHVVTLVVVRVRSEGDTGGNPPCTAANTTSGTTSPGRRGVRKTHETASKDRGFIHASTAGTGEELFVDVGAYGNPSVPHYEYKESHRRIEEYVRSVQGYQMMYADSYMTK